MLSDIDSLAKTNDPGLVSCLELHPDLSDTNILTGPSKSILIFFKYVLKRCEYNV